MAGVMDGVDRRTQLVGRNRMELLLFRLGGRQRFGINVFKIREVVRCPPLTRMPKASPMVRGVANMRGSTITLIDLGMAIGARPVENLEEAFVVITEFNLSVQGFLVSGVERIVNMNWEDILPPPKGTGQDNYMTAVTNVDDELVEIIDVEKVLSEVGGPAGEVPEKVVEDAQATDKGQRRVLVVDDSKVARKQITRLLEQVGVEYFVAENGREALTMMQGWADEEGGMTVSERLFMVITDIEMPEMDGYTLTKMIKQDPRMKDVYVLMHTSLSGVFNSNMVKEVGANNFVAKFEAETLANAVMQRVHSEVGDVAAA